MPQIVQQGQLNTTALVVPDLYVVIIPPAIATLNGVPTNVMGVVGTASWGPVGVASIVGTATQYAQTFGPIMPRKYDMGTAVALAIQQGASNFRCVRVTDGTDTAATATLGSSPVNITFNAKYTGSYGNNITVTLMAGSKANTWQAVVGIAGATPEVFNNIAGTGAAFWANLASAINSGNSVTRGPSNYITATAGTGTTAPSAGTTTLSGGTDGATTITAGTLVGTDVAPYKGMYCLQGQGCSIGMLADADDSTQWTTIDGFGAQNGIYMIQVMPEGTTVAGAVTALQTAGLDSPNSKMMHGDWIYWNDQTNNILRLVSPQGFVAGLLANLSPQNSTLNKQLYGVVGSQKSGAPGTGQMQVYASADLQTLFQAGIDVISNPQPGGSYWGVRGGINTSANEAENGDNYTRMTNYLAATLAAGMGVYVGQLINASIFNNVTATLNNFLANLLQQGLLGSLDGSLPYAVTCNTSNNPFSMTSLGYLQALVQVQYQAINRYFIVNLEGGQTVTIAQQNAPQS
jgi:uncharacterized protein